MTRQAKIATVLIVFLLPIIATAQFVPVPASFIDTQGTALSLPGTVDLVVEAETYTPAFYRGRAEPTPNNTIRLVAIPVGESPENFSYQWSVNGQALSSSGPVATFSDPIRSEWRVAVSVRDANGKAWARTEEIVRLSEPQVVFYEANVLRGHGSKAIGNSYTLVGEEGVVRAEPYFISLQTTPGSYRADWEVNGETVSSGGDWRELLLQRPEEPLSSYRIEFSALNNTDLSDSIRGSFNLNFGL